MPTEFKMPMLGEVMEEGKIVTWHKQEGDHVERGENLIEVETDKATMEVESTTSGILQKILVPVGEIAAVNATLAIID
jgi:pyruvate dehydrogenase E2 component (dihydrolipoamide acetyltransferase)